MPTEESNQEPEETRADDNQGDPGSSQDTLPVDAKSASSVKSFKKIGEYEIVGELGRGAMGTVYKAYQKSLKRHVALKVLPSSLALSKQSIQRFEREARASADLHHPNIAPVYEVGQDGEIYYFTMEYIAGKTLADLIKENIPLRKGLDLLIQVAKALHHAHSKGLVHRDVKPSNIMIEQTGRVLLMDFGLSRPEESVEITRDGSVLGTPAYMSPEQAQGKVVDDQADIYSLGAILYELLTRQRPFSGANVGELLKKVIDEEPKPPRSINSSIARNVETICLKAMDKDKARRYRTSQEFADDLLRYINEEPIRAKPVARVTKVINKMKKHKGVSFLVGALVVVIIGFGTYLVTQTLLERARWRLVFEDNFERKGLGDTWLAHPNIWYGKSKKTTDKKYWFVDNGQLVCDFRFGTFLLMKEEISGDVRLEFDAYMVDSTTSGINVFLKSTLTPGKRIDKQGYAFIMGGARGFSYIQRLGVHIFDTKNKHIAVGRWHHVSITSAGYTLEVKVDGQVLLKTKDYFPLTGSTHSQFGFHSWKGATRYDNIKIYRSTLALKSSPMLLADELFRLKNYDEANRHYEDLISNYPDKEEAIIARYKIGHLLLQSGNYDKALASFDYLIQHFPQHELALRSEIEKGFCMYNRGEKDKAEGHFDRLMRDYTGSAELAEIAEMYLAGANTLLNSEWNHKDALEELKMVIKYSVYDYHQVNAMRSMREMVRLLCTLPYDSLHTQHVEEIREKVFTLNPVNHFFAGEIVAELIRYYSIMDATLAIRFGHEYLTNFQDSPGIKQQHLCPFAESYAEIGEYDEAISMFNKEIQNNPNHHSTAAHYLSLGKIYTKMGEYTKAEKSFNEIVLKYSDMSFQKVNAERWLGNLSLIQGKYKSARTYYHPLLKENKRPNMEELSVTNSLNALYLLENQGNRPIDHGVELELKGVNRFELFAADCERLYLLSLIHWKKGSLSSRNRYLQAIIVKYVHHPFVLLARYHQKIITEAAFLEQSKDYPRLDKIVLFTGLGEDNYMRKKYKKAIRYFSQAHSYVNKNGFFDIDCYFYVQLAEKRLKELGRKVM